MEIPGRVGREWLSCYVDWSTLASRTFGIGMLECPRCHQTIRPVAVITSRERIARILPHLRLPLTPESLSEGWGVGFEVTAEPVPNRAVGTDPEPDEREPPDCWHRIDPPAPND
jgi:hypothetical protein